MLCSVLFSFYPLLLPTHLRLFLCGDLPGEQRCRAAQKTAALRPQRSPGEQQCARGKTSQRFPSSPFRSVVRSLTLTVERVALFTCACLFSYMCVWLSAYMSNCVITTSAHVLCPQPDSVPGNLVACLFTVLWEPFFTEASAEDASCSGSAHITLSLGGVSSYERVASSMQLIPVFGSHETLYDSQLAPSLVCSFLLPLLNPVFHPLQSCRCVKWMSDDLHLPSLPLFQCPWAMCMYPSPVAVDVLRCKCCTNSGQGYTEKE